MTRREFSRKVKRDAATRAAGKCECCGNAIERGYAISAARASRPKFCSKTCQAALRTASAAAALQSRFWGKVKSGSPDECWPWAGRISSDGYGRFDHLGRPLIASRVAYELSHGPAGDKSVCHLCDNPPCCNPAHLWLGTQADNMADAASKGRLRSNGLNGHNHPRAKLTESDVRNIRASSVGGSQLAAVYGVTAANIYRIRQRLTWRHLAP